MLAGRGDSRALKLAADAVKLSRRTDFVNVQADALVDFAVAMRLLGREEYALPALTEALSLYKVKGNVVSATRLQPLLAELDREAAR